MIDVSNLYWTLEPHFLIDFIFFSSKIRLVRAQNYDHLFNNKDERDKRAAFIGVTDIYYQAIESLAAVCIAIQKRFPIDPNVVALPVNYTMATYNGESAALFELLGSEPQTLAMQLPLNFLDAIAANVDKECGPNTASKIKHEIYNYLATLSTALAKNDKLKIKIYNKIKHCGMVVYNGKRLLNSQPDSPAIIRNIVDKTVTPISHTPQLVSLKYSSEEYDLMKIAIKSIEQIQLHLLAAYLIHDYLDELKIFVPDENIYTVFSLK